MHLSDYEQHRLDEQSGAAEDHDLRGRCPRCGCRLIVGRNGEVFARPICPNCAVPDVDSPAAGGIR